MTEFFIYSYYLSEVFHGFFMFVFIWTLYIILTKKYTPFSNIYASMYLGIHAFYNGCPLTTFQNYLAERAGFEVVDNIFLRTNLGSLELPLRILTLFFTLILLYSTYRNFLQFKIKPEYWTCFWLEKKFNKETIPPEICFTN
jgi:hypothetical protein